MRAIVLQHEAHEHLGLLGPALTDAGFTLGEALSRRRAQRSSGRAGRRPRRRHDGRRSGAPFLGKEQAFLSERLTLDRPCLGICLGAQLLAAAAGSSVFKGKNGLEVGVGPVRWTGAARADPVFAGLPAKLNVAHWHEDTFDPVAGAELLASSDRYTQQALRRGSSYAFQFHPELDAKAWLEWVELSADALAAAGKDVAALKNDAAKLKAVEPQLKALCAQLAHHFVGCISA